MQRASSPELGIKPFLKWPGGKRWLAKELALSISNRLDKNYYEPFLGGGAVFFTLRPKQAVLSDINGDLINVYLQVKFKPEELIDGLKELPISKDIYYNVRNSEPEELLNRAIRFLYLNRTAFGGLYRLNSHGKFNVPYGGGNRTPKPLWEDKLIERASIALQNVDLKVCDFERIMCRVGEGDVVYCDPTYTSTHNNNGFIRYNEKNFSWEDQKRLALTCLATCKRGALVIVSNASYKCLQELYAPFEPIVLTRKSLISRKTASRRLIQEYLFILDPNMM